MGLTDHGSQLLARRVCLSVFEYDSYSDLFLGGLMYLT